MYIYIYIYIYTLKFYVCLVLKVDGQTRKNSKTKLSQVNSD